MKKNNLFIVALTLILGLAFNSCAKKEPSALIPLVDKLNLDLMSDAENSPMFLSEATADIDSLTSVITIKVDFCDSIINVEKISDAIVQYYTAQQLKEHPGEDLNVFLNTLSLEKGSMNLVLADVYGHSREYTMDASRLKQLYKLTPMQLNFNEVKENVLDIFEEQCDFYKGAARALDCTFELKNGFAEYTLTFEKEQDYANLNQGSLKGRYLHFLQPRYEDFQGFRYPIVEFLKSLQIDGYRFVYVTKDGKGKELRSAIPWRDI